MIPLSARLAPAAGLLAALAAVPVWLHAGLDPRTDPCPGAEAFLESDRIGGGRVTERAPFDEKREFRYVDGELEVSGGIDSLRFRVARGWRGDLFQAGSLVRTFSETHYRRAPEEVSAIDLGDRTLHVRWGVDRLDVAMHRVRAYALFRGRDPIRSPHFVGLGEALDRLVRGRAPHTAFMFLGIGPRYEEEQVREAAIAWFVSAVGEYDRACGAS